MAKLNRNKLSLNRHNLKITGPNWMTSLGSGTYFTDEKKSHYLIINITGVLSSAVKSFEGIIEGITFIDIDQGAGSNLKENGVAGRVATTSVFSGNTSSFIVEADSNFDIVSISDIVQIAAKPDWI